MIKEFTAGKLTVKIFETAKALGDAAAKDAVKALKGVIAQKGECSVVFAAAPSQNEFLDALAKSDVDWSKVTAFHMDEYIGLPADAPQGFGNFLKRGIFDKVRFKQVNLINGQEDIEVEIARYSTLFRQNPPDMIFMGIGENGHIAFNDPHEAHFDEENIMRKVELDERCRIQQVNDKCFTQLSEVPTHAFTLTIPALMSGKQLFCMVPHSNKAEAVTKTVTGEIRERLPASILRLHSNAALYVDSNSGKDII